MSDERDISNSEKTFRTQVGSKATVSREKMGSEKASIPNRILAELGGAIQAQDDFLKHFRYMGSAAVHVFWNETLLQMAFVSQTQPLDLYKCPEGLAAKAFDDLLGSMKELYRGRRPKLRSGF